jgi:hypothetical protein
VSQLGPPPGLTYSPTNPTCLQGYDVTAGFQQGFTGAENDIVHQHRQSVDTRDRTFRPTTAAVRRGGLQLHANGSSAQQTALVPRQQVDPTPRDKVDRGFSENYKGNIYIEKNRSANIPDEENCSVFIRGLPLMVTYRQVMVAIRNTGRVDTAELVISQLPIPPQPIAENSDEKCQEGAGTLCQNPPKEEQPGC